MTSHPSRTSKLRVHKAGPKREALEQQTTDVRASLVEEQETYLQHKCQGSAAHRKPQDLSEVGVLPAHQLHPQLESCLSRSLMPGKFSLQYWKPELINREDRHRKVFLASAMFVNYVPLFTVRHFKRAANLYE